MENNLVQNQSIFAFLSDYLFDADLCQDGQGRYAREITTISQLQ
jgi:hypothetical protein